MTWRDQFSPLLLASLITLLNALKPAVVDDTAYLLFARQLATHPLDPYGFDLFWYSLPEPAMEILLPPVVPYWLAAGAALFGEHLFLLKLWLFPFAWLLCAAVRSLLVRFAPHAARIGLVVFALSPAVLPLFSFMLDVPALALGAAALAAFVKGVEDRRFGWVLVGGLLAGLAMQTKYSMLVTPAVMTAYALVTVNRSRGGWGVLSIVAALGVAAGVFAAWEGVLHQKYGTSHFLFHLRSQSDKSVFDRLTDLDMIGDLLKQFGGLTAGVWLVSARAAGFNRWVQVVGTAVFAGAIAAICLLPYSRTVIDAPTDLPSVVFFTCAAGVFVSLLFAALRLVFGGTPTRDTLFLFAWLVVEIVGTLGMTPFPAARRVMGVCLATSVLALHLIDRLSRRGVALPSRWTVTAAVAWGLLVFAVDCWDARAEPELADRAAEMVRPTAGETVWFTGHWGFQYYAERHGMTHFITRSTVLRRGDWLVLPVMPDREGFYRPWPPDRELPKPAMRLELVAELVADDALSAQTIPNLHGGGLPLKGRDHPRLRVVVYRVLENWGP